MARIRYLKPEFFTDEALADFPLETRITYAGLWCHADKAGRLEDRPKYLKAMIWPYDDVDMELQLEALTKKPFICRYSINGLKLIQIIKWEKHQKPHHTEKESEFPPPPKEEEKGSSPVPLSLKEEEKEKIKIKGTEKQNEGSARLRNGEATVRKRLKSTTEYNCPYFQGFWMAYPRKEGKGKAWEEWTKIHPTPNENFLILIEKAISLQKQTDQWAKEDGRFIPFPATWLHQKRWDDEPKINTLSGKVSEKTARSINNLQRWMDSEEEREHEEQKTVL